MQIFFLFLGTVLILILFKESQIFDLGFIIRKLTSPQKVSNQLLLPPEDLEQSYQELLAKNAQLQALAAENKELRDFFNWQQTKKYDLILANVLSRDDFNQNLIMIDAGQKQGLSVGAAVVVNQGVIVGKIIEVRNDVSLVRLLTDSSSRLAVAIGDEQNVSGVLTGSLGLGMNLSYIPQEQEIKKGDLVVTNNLNEGIPAGLVIGKAEEIAYSEEEVFKTASVSPLIDYTTLFLVGVIKLP